jgi:peptidoglycan DL-endopeptidase CwlO
VWTVALASRTVFNRRVAPARRSLISAIVGVLALVITAAAFPASARAASIEDKRAKAAELAARLDDLRVRAEQLSEDLNESTVQLDQLNTRISDVRAQLVVNQAAAAKVQTRLDGWTLEAYVSASSSDDVFSVLDPGVSLDSAASLQGYLSLAVGNDSSAADDLAANAEDTVRLQGELDDQLAQQQLLQAAIEAKQTEVIAAVGETEQLLEQTKGELADLIAEAEARRAAAEQAAAEEAAQRRAADERAASDAARAAESAGVAAPNPNQAPQPADGGGAKQSDPAPVYIPPPPPTSPGAAGAVEAAMSVLGTRYRWAGDSPSEGFDCSGLITWAYSQVGRSLPHSSRALYAQLPKVSMNDIQPGDLLFYGRPIHHVGMYIGNGQMVHSPQTGDVVKVSSIHRRDLVGATRP